MLHVPEQEGREKPGKRIQLTKRDLETLQVIGEQYAVRLDQLQRLLGKQDARGAQMAGHLSESGARKWLSRMQVLSAVEIDKPLRLQPLYIWLTGAGLQWCDLDFKPLQPAPSTLNHLYWCVQVRLFMAERRPTDVWTGERQLRSEQARAFSSQRKRPALPDAHLRTAKGVIAIEIELSAKDAARTVTLLRERAAQYSTVWYFCSSKSLPRIEAAKKELSPEHQQRIQVYSFSQLE